VDLTVTRPGYATWRKTGPVEPGQKLEATLSRRAIVTVSTLMEEYGQSSGVPGIAVTIGNKAVGTTDARGNLIYTYDGEPGKKVPLTLTADNYIPGTWKTSIVLEGEVRIQRYFYPTTPETDSYHLPVRVQFTERRLERGARPDRASLAAQLFKATCFRSAVPNASSRDEAGKTEH
jgi:hypothetical protein